MEAVTYLKIITACTMYATATIGMITITILSLITAIKHISEIIRKD